MNAFSESRLNSFKICQFLLILWSSSGQKLQVAGFHHFLECTLCLLVTPEFTLDSLVGVTISWRLAWLGMLTPLLEVDILDPGSLRPVSLIEVYGYGWPLWGGLSGVWSCQSLWSTSFDGMVILSEYRSPLGTAALHYAFSATAGSSINPLWQASGSRPNADHNSEQSHSHVLSPLQLWKALYTFVEPRGGLRPGWMSIEMPAREGS